MNLDNLLHTKVGKYILSFLLGLGLASLFRVACKDNTCVVLKAPTDYQQIEQKTYRINDKCYQFKPVATKCSSSMKTVEL